MGGKSQDRQKLTWPVTSHIVVLSVSYLLSFCLFQAFICERSCLITTGSRLPKGGYYEDAESCWVIKEAAGQRSLLLSPGLGLVTVLLPAQALPDTWCHMAPDFQEPLPHSFQIQSPSSTSLVDSRSRGHSCPGGTWEESILPEPGTTL